MRGIRRSAGGLVGRALGLIGYAVMAVVGGALVAFERWPRVSAFFGCLLVVLAVLTWRESKRLARERMTLQLRDEHVPTMSPADYERFCGLLLERAGWKVKHCGKSGDQGADLLAEHSGFTAAVQVKLYRGRVGNAAVQQVVAARRHYCAHMMAVVAPNGYTASAVALARTNGVHLLHHRDLARLAGAANIA